MFTLNLAALGCRVHALDAPRCPKSCTKMKKNLELSSNDAHKSPKSAKLLRLGKKRMFFFVLLSTFRNAADKSAKLLGLGKKRMIFFVLLSTFRNFVAIN